MDKKVIGGLIYGKTICGHIGGWTGDKDEIEAI
jgi:hypothetical protein